MIRELFLDETCGRCRAALVEDGVLQEIHTEKQPSASQDESLFYGRVQAIRSSIHAAFVDIGDELNAFLPLDDDTSLKCGDMLIVQGAAVQANDAKGLRITTKINLAGKWLVLTPGNSGVRISKKVKDAALRAELLELGERICPKDCGLIIRTASEAVTAALLEAETASLYALWQAVQIKARGMTKPGILHKRESLGMCMLRDLRDLTRVITNNSDSYACFINAQKEQRISDRTRIEFFEEKERLLFDAYGIEPQIDKVLRRRVWLPCGGYLIIDLCEALTVIDVNSGKMILGRDLEDTALQVNLEAADEIARQLRLRDLGGIIIVDFIDMSSMQNRHLLLERMKTAVSHDRTPVSVEGITKLGLMEITRKRIHASVHRQMQTSCSYCSGSAAVLAADEVACRALRQVRRMALSGQRGPFIIRCAPAAAQALAVIKNPLSSTQVYALAVPGKHAEKFDIEQIGAETQHPRDAVLLM